MTTGTTCPYCGVGCGVLATPGADGVTIAGDPEHPANRGRLCSKGVALGETLDLDDRLLHPMVAGRQVDWDTALDRVATTFADTIAAHGPDSVAFYVSGQLLTEDYYVANKLMKGYIGSANIDTNSRLCMASSVAGHRRAFGSDTVPGTYEDLELADVTVLVGSNLAWCHPVLFQRLLAAREARGTRIVVIDPRRTATAEVANLHLPLRPGSDVALFAGLLDRLRRVADAGYVARHTAGATAALAAAAEVGLDGAARATGLPPALLAEFYDLFAITDRVVTVYSQGVNQSTAGTDKVNAIINCHLLTGRIGRPGAGPFSVTGQPNAMGGREVGGLANMLAAHLEIEKPAHRDLVQGFWRSPTIATRPGLKAVDLFRAVGDGHIKALWIMATNPADSLPEADTVQAALAACPFVVVSDVAHRTDTTRHADVLLPAAAWGEKSGTVTNSERRISRQRAFLPLPGEARPDWWIVCEVARRMGFTGFDYDGPAAIFREYAALTARENNGARDLDLGGLAELDDDAYDALAPVQWPVPARPGVPAETRFFAAGGFFTADRRARLVPTPPAAPASAVDARYPFALNTGRIRDQWHTMTRTAKTPRLSAHLAEPFVELNPADADRLGIAPATLARIESRQGTIVVRALLSDRQPAGTCFVPMHWTDQLASQARVDTLVAGQVDPVSGQPELKHTPVAVEPLHAAWYGFAVSAARPRPSDLAYWALARAEGGWRLELAGATAPDDWRAFFAELCGLSVPPAAIHTYSDAGAGVHRLAAFAGPAAPERSRSGSAEASERLLAAMFVAPEPVAVSRTWAAGLLQGRHDGARRLALLAGRGGADAPDTGALVCACCAVGTRQIEAAVAAGAHSVDAVGAATRAGSNCGSCRAEIGRLIDACRLRPAV
jgi:assimilatory nitrate reductase catalytic subunit